MNKYFLVLVILFTALTQTAHSQEIIIRGKIIDAESGEGMPLVNIVNKATNNGTTTDFDGFYSIKLSGKTDSLTAFYFGYITKSKSIDTWMSQTINFQLQPNAGVMEEITVIPGENPAFRILREVVKHKEKNDKRILSAYEYESYTRTELSIDNISDKFRQKKVMKKLARVFDSLAIISGDDGKPILPVFVSESISKFYHRKNPDHSKEEIKGVKITGVGIDNGSVVSQLIGSSFQEYNFYKNWLTIVEKEFISPIADGWDGFYNYRLTDSALFHGAWCYKLEFKPKRVQDLAFTGTMWIADTSFALKQMDVTIGKQANINYIDKIKIQQELVQVQQGTWIPAKTRVLIDIDEIGETSPGMIAKFYISNKDIVVNHPKPAKFYNELIEVDEEANIKNSDYWEKMRHDSLSQTEKDVYKMIDSVKNVPLIKTYVDIINIVVNGYKTVYNGLDVGPYLFLYNNNNIEGHRFRLGLKTNVDFSHRWILKGYLAYGTLDDKIKYGLGATYILSRKPWTILNFERKFDIYQAGIQTDYIDNTLFLAFVNNGTLRKPYYNSQNSFSFQTDLHKDYTQKVTFRTRDFQPLFPFAYYKDLKGNDTTQIGGNFSVSEMIIESRFAKDEIFIQRAHERMSLGTKKWPVFTVRYTMGLKGVINSDFNYHKLTMNINHILKLGTLGKVYYDLVAGRIFSSVPFPLMEVHQGNQSLFYINRAYNLMNYFEFISDTYVSLKYRHYFEGLLFNRIPAIKKLKWRFLATSNVLYGGISKKNHSVSPQYITNEFSQFTRNKPYVEVGYGIENIFKVLRVDFIHRLTYLDRPNVSKFGIKFSLQFIL